MKENYLAWKVDFEVKDRMSDKELLRHLIDFAVLAPSSHNSQPWKFRISEDSILLSPDFTRELTASDPKHRQLYLSLGCAAQTITTAADFYGADLDLSILNESGSVSMKMTLVNRNQPRYDEADHLAYSIPERTTNRSKYEMKPIPDSLVSAFTAIAEKQAVRIDFIHQDNKHRGKIIDLVMDATNEAMVRQDFRKELSQYLKPNITSSFIGMPCFGMHIPTPVSLLAPTLMKHFNMGKLSEKMERITLTEHTPAFVILSHLHDTPESWISAGIAYNEMALLSTKKGYSTNPLAALIEIGTYYQEFQNMMDTALRPLFFFRLGKAVKKTKHSPRLMSEAVTIV